MRCPLTNASLCLEMGLDLGPPIGDAGEMRAKAGRLAIECEQLVGQAHDLDRVVLAMDYECRAADRFRDEVRTQRACLDRIIDELHEAQRRLLREAGRVEAAHELFVRLTHDAQVAGGAVDAGLRDAYNELRNLAAGGA